MWVDRIKGGLCDVADRTKNEWQLLLGEGTAYLQRQEFYNNPGALFASGRCHSAPQQALGTNLCVSTLSRALLLLSSLLGLEVFKSIGYCPIKSRFVARASSFRDHRQKRSKVPSLIKLLWQSRG
jgi:hypothetical protein